MLVSDLIMGDFRQINAASILIRLLLCVLCGGIVGLERESKGRAAGLRTHVLVSVGSAIVMLTNQYISQYIAPGTDPARLGAQVVSGIGFLGAGSIIVTRSNRVTGLATAAGLWASGCLGIAIGIGLYEVGILGTIIILFAERVLGWVDETFFKKERYVQVYFEMEGMEPVREIIKTVKGCSCKIQHMEMIKSRVKNSGNKGLLVTFSGKTQKASKKRREISDEAERSSGDIHDCLRRFSDIPGILFFERIGS